MDLFNEAMLAKQGWRFLQNPSTALVSKVFQHKNFANGDFMYAKKGGQAFCLWKSLFFGRDLLLKGIGWRVGLPTVPAFKSATQPSFLYHKLLVADLHHAGVWRAELLAVLFFC